jgi:GTP-binding protein
MTFSVNDSPLGGKEGKFLTSTMIRERLHKEAETNVALQITDIGEAVEVRGRGELQLGILIETMRREGFEMSVSPPKVLLKWGESKQRLEPIEEVIIDVDHEYAGVVIEKLSKRKGELVSYDESGSKARLNFLCPTRGILSYNAEFKNDTHGTGTLNHVFHSYAPFKGEIEKNRKGALLATAMGEATPYALSLIEQRGQAHMLCASF